MQTKRLFFLPVIVLALIALPACEKDKDEIPADTVTISGLTCSSAAFSGTATAGVTYNGVFTVPYIGGDGSEYKSDNGSSSIGVTGLSAILVPGTLAVGAGMLTYAVSGTPTAGGNASFNINFGGQSCIVSLPVTPSDNVPVPVPQ